MHYFIKLWNVVVFDQKHSLLIFLSTLHENWIKSVIEALLGDSVETVGLSAKGQRVKGPRHTLIKPQWATYHHHSTIGQRELNDGIVILRNLYIWYNIK